MNQALRRRMRLLWIVATVPTAIVFCAQGPTAEAAAEIGTERPDPLGAAARQGASAMAAGTAGDDDEGAPSPNCAVDAGTAKRPNGQPCSNPRDCESGFCSKFNTDCDGARPGVCAACTNSLRTKNDLDHGGGPSGLNPFARADGYHEVLTCVSMPTEVETYRRLRCSTAFHRPCNGTHQHLIYELCFANSGPIPKQRCSKGVRCLGSAPAPRADCSIPPSPTLTQFGWQSCGNEPQENETSGEFDNRTRQPLSSL